MNKKLILFDFDGTVIDGSEGIFRCITNALKIMGKEIPEEKVLRKFIGPSLFSGYMTNIEENPGNAERFIELYRERYAPVGYKEARLYPGIKELLENLHKEGYFLAVCSSKPIEFVRKISENLGTDEFFSCYFCPGFSSVSSSKTELILEGIKHFGLEKEDAVIVGDTKYDIEAAKGADIESIGVLYGFGGKEELEKAGADRIVSSPGEVYKLISGEIK